jgi:hypothetical protein
MDGVALLAHVPGNHDLFRRQHKGADGRNKAGRPI